MIDCLGVFVVWCVDCLVGWWIARSCVVLVVHPVVVLVCFMCACWFVGRLFVCLMGVGVCVLIRRLVGRLVGCVHVRWLCLVVL